MIPIHPALHHQALIQIEQCIFTAATYFATEIKTPTLSYQLRGKAAGKAYLHRWEIRLNPVLFVENQTEFLQQVIPHEVAHLIVYLQYGNVKPHGQEWQSLMQSVFHLSPLTTHQFDIHSVIGKTFAYQCQCQQHALTVRRHHKVQRKQAIYRCSQCHQPLQYIDTQSRPCDKK